MLNENLPASGEVDSILDLHKLILAKGEMGEVNGCPTLIARIEKGSETLIVRDSHHTTLGIVDFFEDSNYFAEQGKESYWLNHYGEDGAFYELSRDGDITFLDLKERQTKRTEKGMQMIIDSNLVGGLIELLPSHV